MREIREGIKVRILEICLYIDKREIKDDLRVLGLDDLVNGWVVNRKRRNRFENKYFDYDFVMFSIFLGGFF